MPFSQGTNIVTCKLWGGGEAGVLGLWGQASTNRPKRTKDADIIGLNQRVSRGWGREAASEPHSSTHFLAPMNWRVVSSPGAGRPFSTLPVDPVLKHSPFSPESKEGTLCQEGWLMSAVRRHHRAALGKSRVAGWPEATRSL